MYYPPNSAVIVVPGHQSFQFQASLAQNMSTSYGFHMPPKHDHKSKPKYETYRGEKSKHSWSMRSMAILTVFLRYMLLLLLLRDSQENEAHDDENKSNENEKTVAH